MRAIHTIGIVLAFFAASAQAGTSDSCFVGKVAYQSLKSTSSLMCKINGGGTKVIDPKVKVFFCNAAGKEFYFDVLGYKKYYAECVPTGRQMTREEVASIANYLECDVVNGAMTLEAAQGIGEVMMCLSDNKYCTNATTQMIENTRGLTTGTTENVFCPPEMSTDKSTKSGQGAILRDCYNIILERAKAQFHDNTLGLCPAITDWSNPRQFDREIVEALGLIPKKK